MSYFIQYRPPNQADMKKSDYDKDLNNIVDIAEGLLVWEKGCVYKVHNLVVYDNDIWKCTKEHTSTTVFDEQSFINLTKVEGLHPVAYTGSYNDLEEKPIYNPNVDWEEF